MSIDFPFKMRGRLRYDPYRGTMSNQKWWCVVELPPGLCAYLRWHLDRNWWHITDAIKPTYFPNAWGDHVSLIRGERPRFPDRWKYLDGEKVDVYYDLDVKAVKDYWYVDCYVPVVRGIREGLGLPNKRGDREFTNHITIAKNRGN